MSSLTIDKDHPYPPCEADCNCASCFDRLKAENEELRWILQKIESLTYQNKAGDELRKLQKDLWEEKADALDWLEEQQALVMWKKRQGPEYRWEIAEVEWGEKRVFCEGASLLEAVLKAKEVADDS